VSYPLVRDLAAEGIPVRLTCEPMPPPRDDEAAGR